MISSEKTPLGITFSRALGRLKITATLFGLGPDLVIFLGGGDQHLGAVALAATQATMGCLQIPGHRESDPATRMASAIAAACGRNVAVCAGIHYDGITSAEISQVLAICDILTTEIMNFLASGPVPETGAAHAGYETT